MSEPSGGRKDDTNKPRPELIDARFYLDMARVMAFGARKYAAENWRKGIEVQRLVGAIERHVAAFKSGETIDPESGLPHLAHAAIDCMMADITRRDRPCLDNRVNTKAPFDNPGVTKQPPNSDFPVTLPLPFITPPVMPAEKHFPIMCSIDDFRKEK